MLAFCWRHSKCWQQISEGIGRMGKFSRSALTVGLLTYAACMGSAAAQTPASWHAHNRYIELARGQHQQNYREQDTNGLTADGILDTETGHQDHISAALRWQTENGWLLNLQAQRQTGATDYNGYLQSGSGLTPFRTTTGNVTSSYAAQLGYALNSATWAAMPEGWQLVPMVQVSRYDWLRNLAQYSETYRYSAWAAGAMLQWQARPGTVFELQALSGRTGSADVNVPSLNFAARQPGGAMRQWHIALSQDLGLLANAPSLQGWRVLARYSKTNIAHGASPVANGLQAPPNQHRSSAWMLGVQKQF
jgi:hypothetical protein